MRCRWPNRGRTVPSCWRWSPTYGRTRTRFRVTSSDAATRADRVRSSPPAAQPRRECLLERELKLELELEEGKTLVSGARAPCSHYCYVTCWQRSSPLFSRHGRLGSRAPWSAAAVLLPG